MGTKGKGFTGVAIFLFLMFVFIGDKVLPKPLSTTSAQIRNTMDNYLMGMFPEKRFRNPNARTENAVESLEQQQNGSQNR